MADTVKTVNKTSGSDYASLSNWEAGQQCAISAGDRQLAECYAGSGADTTAVAIAGWTTVATGYILIYGATSERTSSNTGKWSTARYRLSVSNSVAFNQTEDFVRVEGLQISTPTQNADNQSIVDEYAAFGASSYRSYTNCIFVGSGNGTCYQSAVRTGANGTLDLINCIAYNLAGIANTGMAAVYVAGGAGTFVVSNCTFIGGYCTIFRNDSTVTINNTYCGGASYGSGCFYGSMTLNTCASSDSTGTAGLQSIAVSTTADSTHAGFTNVTGGSEDFHIKVGSPLIDVGTDLSVTFTTDIDGQTRPTGAGTWDIGADEYVAGGATAIKQMMESYRHRRT